MNHNKNNSNEIASKELNLNIVNQKIQVKDFSQVGYEWDKGIFVFMLMIPKNMLGFRLYFPNNKNTREVKQKNGN